MRPSERVRGVVRSHYAISEILRKRPKDVSEELHVGIDLDIRVEVVVVNPAEIADELAEVHAPVPEALGKHVNDRRTLQIPDSKELLNQVREGQADWDQLGVLCGELRSIQRQPGSPLRRLDEDDRVDRLSGWRIRPVD